MSVTYYGGPSLTVEIGFASAPSTAIASTSWTDVTAYVRSLSWRTGRSTESDTFNAGTAQIVFDNHLRRFDPTYTAGAYYGNLLPMKRVRIRATYSAVTYDLWAGFVDGWPQEYEVSNHDSISTVTCTDGFKWLSRARLPESAWADLMQDEVGLSAWYRLGEQSGTTMVDSTTNQRDGVYVSGAVFDSRTGLIGYSTDAAISVDVVAPVATASFDLLGGTSTWAFQFWVSALPIGGATVSYVTLCFGRQTGTCIQLYLTNEPTKATCSAHYFQAGTLSSIWDVYSTTNIGTGTHLVMVTYETTAGGTCSIYVDNTLSISTTGLGSVGPFESIFSVVPSNLTGILASYTGTIDELAVWSGALPTASVALRYQQGVSPWENSDTGTQVGRVLDVVAWPSADRTIGTGSTSTQPLDYNFQTALAFMQTLEMSEQGRLYMGPDGKVVFRARTYTSTKASSVTSQATFGDSGSELPYSAIEFDYSDTFLRNRVIVARDNGLTVDAKDTTSITAYGEVSDSLSGLIGNSDTEIRDLAAYRLTKYAQPGLRVTALEVKPRKAAATLYPQVLGRIIGDRLTVKRRPQGVGTAISTDTLIEGIETSVDVAGNWTTRWYLSPTETTAFLVLNDTTLGQLDSNALGF